MKSLKYLKTKMKDHLSMWLLNAIMDGYESEDGDDSVPMSYITEELEAVEKGNSWVLEVADKALPEIAADMLKLLNKEGK